MTPSAPPPIRSPLRHLLVPIVPLVLLGLLTVPARAQPQPVLGQLPLHIPLAMVIRGGGSLGAFEAGALYYLAAFSQRNSGLVALRLVTGTSAGSINAVLSVVENCSAIAAAPYDSLYFKTWAGVGLESLFVPERAGATGIFTRDAFEGLVAAVKDRWDAGLHASCDMVIGIPVTRVVARRLAIANRNQLDVARVDERFVVRIQGRGPGRPPRMTNYVAHGAGVAAPALVSDDRGEVSFDALMQVVYASSGVPVVFPPIALPFCLVGDTRSDTKTAGGGPPGPFICRAADAEVVELVDGGLLDNQPLRLAATTARTGLDDQAGATARWRDVPDLSDATLPAGMAFMAIDPTAMPWLPGKAERKAKATSLRELLGSLLPGVLESALTAELQQVLIETPELGKRLGVLQGDWPLMSGGLGSLMGFMERDFRTFDFYLGMVEARRLTEELILPWAAPLGHGNLPDPDLTASPAVRAAWRPYRCALAVMRGQGDDAVMTQCDGLDAQFLALLQTSLDLAASKCRALTADAVAKLPAGPDSDARAHCRKVHAGAPTRRVPGVPNASEGSTVTDEGNDETLRLLVLHHFRFRDLGLGRASFHTITTHIAALVHQMLRAIADQQTTDETLWRIAGRSLSQAFAYRPPAHALHLLAGGTWELGWSATDDVAAWSWLRFGLGVQFDGVPSALEGEVQTYLGLTLAAGIELEPTGLSGPLAQMRLGLRGGFRFASGDGFRGSLADPTPDAPRSRPVVELYGSLTLIQWLRLQLGVTWYPPFESNASTWAVRPMLGVELDLPL